MALAAGSPPLVLLPHPQLAVRQGPPVGPSSGTEQQQQSSWILIILGTHLLGFSHRIVTVLLWVDLFSGFFVKMDAEAEKGAS